jgi:hypothetical protein
MCCRHHRRDARRRRGDFQASEDAGFMTGATLSDNGSQIMP